MANITKRGNSYRIRVSCGYDVKGKQMFQAKTWKPDPGMTEKQIKKELERQAVLFEEDCSHGQITAAIKFQTFAEQWIEEYAKLNMRKSTFTLQRQLTYRIYPAIGHLRLDKITARDIQRFINDLMINGKNRNTGKPLSRKSAIHHLSFISSVFNYAIRMEMLTNNPCSKVIVPKGETKEKQIYTIDEINKLFEVINDEPLKYRAYFVLSVYSGFRRGEMLGLEWKDINWDTSVISVRRTSNYNSVNGIYTDTTKTKTSKRSSKFPPAVMELLKELKAEQDAERELLGTQWVETDRLFVKWNGEPMGSSTTYNWLKKVCKRNNIRFCDLHSLRHFHASVLIFAGVDPVTVSRDMGHSCPTTTTSIYCHLFQEAQARTCDILANTLSFGKNDSKKTA